MTRAFLSLVLVLAVLAGPRLDAAVNLLGSSDARVEFGNPVGAETALSVALTLRTGASFSNDQRIAGMWAPGIGGSQQSWLLVLTNTDELAVVMHGGSLSYFGKVTTDSPLATNTLHRIVFTWQVGTPNVTRIWVNGTERAQTSTVGSANLTALADTAGPLFVGRADAEGFDGVDGEYSEFAVWRAVVPDWFVTAYTNGLSPSYYRTGAILYAPMPNHTDTRDLWGGILGTNTGGTSATSPSMYYPHAQ